MNSKEPEKIESIIISKIIGNRPIKPASYEMRKLRKSKEDLIVCYNYEQALQNWENEAQKIRNSQPKYENENFVIKERPPINATVKDIFEDFIQTYKILSKRDFNKVNPYSKSDEPNKYLFTLIFYFLNNERFFDSPLLRKDLSEPSFDKGTLSIGGYGCGKTSTMMALILTFRNHVDFVKNIMPSNEKEILKKFEINSCISTDVVNRYGTTKKNYVDEVLNPLMSSKQLYIDDILREEDGDNFGRLNIFKTVLTHRADFGYKTHLTTNYLEVDSDGVVEFLDTETSLLKFRSRYDGRIHDRLFGMYNIIELKGKSFRR